MGQWKANLKRDRNGYIQDSTEPLFFSFSASHLLHFGSYIACSSELGLLFGMTSTTLPLFQCKCFKNSSPCSTRCQRKFCLSVSPFSVSIFLNLTPAVCWNAGLFLMPVYGSHLAKSSLFQRCESSNCLSHWTWKQMLHAGLSSWKSFYFSSWKKEEECFCSVLKKIYKPPGERFQKG